MVNGGNRKWKLTVKANCQRASSRAVGSVNIARALLHLYARRGKTDDCTIRCTRRNHRACAHRLLSAQLAARSADAIVEHKLAILGGAVGVLRCAYRHAVECGRRRDRL